MFDGIYYLVKCPKKSLLKSGKKYHLKTKDDSSSSKIVLAFISEDNFDVFSPYENILNFFKVKSNASKGSNASKTSKASNPSKASNNSATVEEVKNDSDFFVHNFSKKCRLLPRISTRSKSEKYSSSNITIQSWTLKSDQYKIILIVDVMEVTGGSAGGKKSRKNITIEELDSLGKIAINFFLYKIQSPDVTQLFSDQSHPALCGLAPRTISALQKR